MRVFFFEAKNESIFERENEKLRINDVEYRK